MPVPGAKVCSACKVSTMAARKRYRSIPPNGEPHHDEV
jgi:hypothetical protein